jgi:hypothetical protein
VVKVKTSATEDSYTIQAIARYTDQTGA